MELADWERLTKYHPDAVVKSTVKRTQDGGHRRAGPPRLWPDAQAARGDLDLVRAAGRAGVPTIPHPLQPAAAQPPLLREKHICKFIVFEKHGSSKMRAQIY